MKEQIAKIKENALAEISNSKTLQELENVRVKYLGKKGELTAVLKGMKEETIEKELDKLLSKFGITESLTTFSSVTTGFEILNLNVFFAPVISANFGTITGV